MLPQWEIGPIFNLEAKITYFCAKSFIFRDTKIANNDIRKYKTYYKTLVIVSWSTFPLLGANAQLLRAPISF